MAGPNKRAKKPAKPELGQSHGNEVENLEQVDFEGRNPEPQDFHGIKLLLERAFLTAHIDLGQMADMLIAQTGIGSVLKQSASDEDEEDMDTAEESYVFAITSVLNLTGHKDKQCVQSLYDLVRDFAKKHADQPTQNQLVQVLDGCSRLGFLINERFVNMPSKISPLMLNSLHAEVDRMKRKDGSYDFEYFLMICKAFRPADNPAGQLQFSNEEEEIFAKQAECKFDFSVAGQNDEGQDLVPHRMVLLITAAKFQSIVNEVTALVG